MMAAQISLQNFYESVKFDNPSLAAEIEFDVSMIGLYALGGDKTQAQDSVDRLRRVAFVLPPIQALVLENTLTDLGFAE